ncbi:MAG TPA: flagellar biosynthesis protein FlhF [Treponemataceae bacterium]|nr:flagellar biosynthesis protein FlhF [Treponemataceae bacterium]
MDLDQKRSDILTEYADTCDDCVSKIRSKYGANYQIIQKTQVPATGLFRVFKRPRWQVRYVLQSTEAFNPYVPSNQLKSFDFKKEQEKILNQNKTSSTAQMKVILDEVQALRQEIESQAAMQQSEEHPNLLKMQNLLEKNEFTASYIRNLTDTLRKDSSLEQLGDFEFVQQSAIDYIGDTIKISDAPLRSRPQVIVLVGPTGVGKTTTVAKMAANFVLPNRLHNAPPKEVRIITIDRYRIAAQEQIEKYGEYMSVPVATAKNEEDLRRLLTMYSTGVDVVLIDTIGYSPKDYENIAKMRKVLNLSSDSSKIYLTVTASTKSSDLREIIQQYEIFGYSSLVITKLDETDCVGNVVSVLDEKNKAVAFFTTGQKVPSDLEKASPIGMLKRLSDFHVNREYIESKFSVIE